MNRISFFFVNWQGMAWKTVFEISFSSIICISKIEKYDDVFVLINVLTSVVFGFDSIVCADC